MTKKPRAPSAAPSTTPPRHGRGPSVHLRLGLVAGLLGLAAIGLVARAVDLQVLDKAFYLNQGKARFLRNVPIPVSRGTIFDRNGEPLAVSTPVESIWANPQKVIEHPDRIPDLARALGMGADELKQYLAQRAGADREFVYLKRQMNPDAAQAILDLNIPGVNEQREYKRYYPYGAITAHVLGFTNIDDQGQEGLELSYNTWLAGAPGQKRVIRDNKGHVVENVELVNAPKPGNDLTLSIDSRIQYLAWRQLKDAVEHFKAASASMVVMDVHNGEILAMVNLPSYNPNAVGNSTPGQRRNRAVTDVVEPGSTAKAFTVAAGLASGKWTPTTKIDTSPGWVVLFGHTIHDDENNGVLDVTGVISRSSNIGAARIALSLKPSAMYDVFRDFGFGQSTGSDFPGESSGVLPISRDWRPIRQATIGYGYGFSVTPLQLAQAYSALANGGVLHQPTFLKGEVKSSSRALDAGVDAEMIDILKTVVQEGGTAFRTAAIPNYTVAGKTGTSRIAEDGGYSDSYNSLFAGFVPASNPRLVGVVVVRGSQGAYFGTTVAAPTFSAVMKGSLRLLDIPPDNVQQWYAGPAPSATSGRSGGVAVASKSTGGATPQQGMR